uniref:Uncharacterized protein n=1 Tax=Amphimedon queenslandica TaxID=400682 RepID=A0A1X7ULB1_AMPQE
MKLYNRISAGRDTVLSISCIF